MALVLFLNSEPNRVSLKTSQNETHRGQFGHFALTIYKHFALHKSREGSYFQFTNSSQTHSLNSLSVLIDQNHKSHKTFIKIHQFPPRSRAWIEDSRIEVRNSLPLLFTSRAPLTLSPSGFRSSSRRVCVVFVFVSCP